MTGLGYVPQKGVLFSGTIDSNLRYGCTDASEAGDRERRPKSPRQSEFIEEKEERYDTPIAQGGDERIRWAEAAAFDCEGNCKEAGDPDF